MGVEQCDRRRLLPGHLAVGVIPNQRAVGHGLVQSVLGGLEPVVELPSRVADVIVQRLELALERSGMVHQIKRTVTEHGALVGSYASQADRQDDATEQGNDRHHYGGQGHHPDSAVQTGHSARISGAPPELQPRGAGAYWKLTE